MKQKDVSEVKNPLQLISACLEEHLRHDMLAIALPLRETGNDQILFF